MKETPILYTTAMVRAILRPYNPKTNTRRVIVPQPPNWRWNRYEFDQRCINVKFGERQEDYFVICPYGKPGDRLWVRETWAHDDPDCTDPKCGNPDHIWYKASENKIVADSFSGAAHWRSSRFMPKWAARIWLGITEIRVERVKSISLVDIEKEGTPPIPDQMSYRNDGYQRYKDFEYLWDSINAKRGYGWDVNPWVWVIEFVKLPIEREYPIDPISIRY